MYPKLKPPRLTIPISEVFMSIEGEGPLTGVPTMFIRSFGCNFTCQGFSNPDMLEPPVNVVENLKPFTPTTGCDSLYSWHKDFKHLTVKYDADRLWEKVWSMLPSYVQENLYKTKPIMFPALSITGGEPMLHQKFWTEFLAKEAVLNNVDKLIIETNSSVPAHPDFLNVLKNLEAKGCNIAWANSPKLSNSGELRERAIKPHILAQQQRIASSMQYLKFVSNGSDESFDEIRDTLIEYNEHLLAHGNQALRYEQVYVMPEGGSLEQQEDIQRMVAEKCIDNGLMFCARVHVWVFDNEIGT